MTVSGVESCCRLSRASLVMFALILTLGLGSKSAQADDAPHGDGHGHHAHHQEDDDFRHWSRSRLSVSVGPRFYQLQDLGWAGVLTSAGFSSPKRGRLGADLHFFWTLPSDWQVGFGLGGLNVRQELGSGDATWMQSYFGLWVARDLIPDTRYDLALGCLLGAGMSELEVLSASTNGRLRERAFILEPSVRAAYQIARFIKLGASFSYLYPVSPSIESKGQSLGTVQVSAQGWSLGAQIILGRFGEPEASGR